MYEFNVILINRFDKYVTCWSFVTDEKIIKHSNQRKAVRL